MRKDRLGGLCVLLSVFYDPEGDLVQDQFMAVGSWQALERQLATWYEKPCYTDDGTTYVLYYDEEVSEDLPYPENEHWYRIMPLSVDNGVLMLEEDIEREKEQ